MFVGYSSFRRTPDLVRGRRRNPEFFKNPYQFSFLKWETQKSLPSSLFQREEIFSGGVAASYSTGGMKGDLTGFQKAKVL